MSQSWLQGFTVVVLCRQISVDLLIKLLSLASSSSLSSTTSFRLVKIYKQNNQGQAWGYQPKPKSDADNPYRDLMIILDITKTEPNNCFILHCT